MRSFRSGLVPLLVLLVLVPVSVLGSVVGKSFVHIRNHLNWTEAETFCKSHYVDLAVFQTQSDEDQVYTKVYYAWIGLYKTGSGSWFWSGTWSRFYLDWADKEPQASDSCGYVVYPHKSPRIYGGDCASRFFFICNKPGDNYKFLDQSKNWSEAQDYCRENHQDLGTFYRNEDLDEVQEEDFPVWIGLRRDGASWNWTSGTSDYLNWGPGEPDSSEEGGDCVAMSALEKNAWVRPCGAPFPFLCLRDSLVLVQEPQTWEGALQHCRGLRGPRPERFEMLSVQPGEDQDYVASRVLGGPVEEVWVGLRFLAGDWLWVNKAPRGHTELPACPSALNHCGALIKGPDGATLEPRDCAERRSFVCYRYNADD